ncbi:MAG: hypothetical protein AABX63_03255, partial [Nanoarchaeota archaeon]
MSTDRMNWIDKKAQMWFMDFVIGIIIFSLVLITYYTYTTNISKQDAVVLNDIISDSKSVSSSLMLAGYPENWDNETVQRIGLTGNNQNTDETKLRYLSDIPYKEAKKLLGTVYDFFMFLEDGNGNLINIGNECGYGSGNASANLTFKNAAYFNQAENDMEDEINQLEQKLGIAIYRDWSSANSMLSNISAYDIVLMENPRFSSNQKTQLENYVSSKGFVFISQGMLTANSGQILGVQYDKGQPNCKKNATVVYDDLFLTLKKGDKIAPEDCPYISGSVTEIAEFPGGETSIAKWDYGNGSIYYFSDFDVTFVGDLQGSIRDAFEASVLICGKASGISFKGTYNNLVKTERPLLFESKPVK